MAEWTVIVKNVSGSDQWLTDFGTIVLSGGQINLTEIATYDEIGGSRDLKDKITNGDFIINDGTSDLDLADSLNFVTLENIENTLQTFYTQTELSSGGAANVHWDNITDAPSFGSPTWKAPVLARAVEIQTPAPVVGAEGDMYIDTSDDVLYMVTTGAWVAQLTASAGDRAIDLSEVTGNNESIFVLSGGSWVESGDPVDGDAVVVLNDGAMDSQSQWTYEESQQTWVKIGSIDFGPHLDGGPNKHDASEIDVEGTYTNITGETDLETTVSSIDSAIGTNAGDISTNAGNISTNAGNISTNAGDITNLQTDVTSLSGAIDTNTGNIESNDTDIIALSGAIDTNTGDITDLQTDVTGLSAAIDVNTGDIGDNTTLITTLSAGLSANHYHETNRILFPNAVPDGETEYVTDLDDYFKHVGSSFIADGFDITDNGDGSVNLASGTAVLREGTDIHNTTLTEYFAPSASISLTDGDTNYVFVEYNAGTPQFVVYLDAPADSGRDNQPLYFITRIGTTVHITDMRTWSHDYAVANSLKDFFVHGYEHKPGGSTLTESTSAGYLNLTAGSFYLATVEHSHTALDTLAADTFTSIYNDGASAWTRSAGETQVDFTNFDDGTGTLAPLSAGYYGVHWVYVLPDHTTDLVVVYGTGNYDTFAAAEAAGVPSQLPPEVDSNSSGQLVGKVVVQEGTTDITQIFTPFVDVLGSASTSTHNNLGGLQGGTTGEYYHLTQTEHDDTVAHIVDMNNPHGVDATDVGLGNVQTDLTALSGAIDTNSSDISTNAGNISTNAGNISTNTGNISNNTTDISSLSGEIDGINLDTAFLSGAIDDNSTDIVALSGAIDSIEHSDLDGAYNLGRTITVDAGSVQLSGASAGYAPLELTPQASAPTLGLASGQIAVIGGILCSYDATRAKWLSVDRQFIVFGKDGTAKSSYMKYYGGGSTSNLSGLRLVRNATIVSLAGQLETYQASQDSTFYLRRNDLLTNIVGSGLLMNAVGVSKTTVDVDLDANDYIQSWLNVTNPSWLISNPMFIVELAWRF